MTTQHEMRTTRRTRRGVTLTALVALIGAAGACGGSDDAPATADSATDASVAVTAAAPDAVPATAPADSAADGAAPDADAPPAVPTGGAGTATLSLDNGESFQFGILCTLEPQIAAGSEILFTATSYDDPGMDITQFGDEGLVVGIATISVYDGSYETLWEASSIYEAFGGTIELVLNGSTITGAGSFYAAGDPSSTPVNGSVVANC